jgi:hypothetical protein
VFRFNPPPNTKVTQSGGTKDSLTGPGTPSGKDSSSAPTAGAGSPKVVGTGWTSVVIAKVPAGATSGSGSMTRVLEALPAVSGTWGSGHLLRGTLFSALLTDDGRLVIGAVAPDALYAALAG